MEYVNRIGTHCSKWDGLVEQFGEDGLLSMWVADMDFAAPACVTQALEEFIRLPLGYFARPDSYFETVVRWERERHGYEIRPEWICVTPGVVPAVYWAINVFTQSGDAVMVSTPVYYPFMNAVNSSGQRRLVKNRLKKTECGYEIDYIQFEKDIVENDVRMYILCNPHNPVGRVWTKDELIRLMEICRRRQVMVISDEIHQDIINPSLGRKKITVAALGDYDDILITMASASKTFNLAAVKNSFIIIPNEEYRKRFKDYMTSLSLSTNGFGFIAAEAALKGGTDWLREVLDIIYSNYEYVRQRFMTERPEVKAANLEGTYLLWLDFGAFFSTHEQMKEFMQGKCKIAMDYGSWFGDEEYNAFARMNLATSYENVKEACDRMITALRP